MIEIGNFQIYKNLEEYASHGYAGRPSIVYVRNENLISKLELHNYDKIKIRSMFGYIYSPFCLIKNNQEFMEQLRIDYKENPRIEICLIDKDFPDYEIQDMNEFISYILEKREK